MILMESEVTGCPSPTTHTTQDMKFNPKEAFMKMAVAVETFKHPERQSDYKIWFLNLGKKGDVIGIGVKTREELIQSLFQEYRESTDEPDGGLSAKIAKPQNQSRFSTLSPKTLARTLTLEIFPHYLSSRDTEASADEPRGYCNC